MASLDRHIAALPFKSESGKACGERSSVGLVIGVSKSMARLLLPFSCGDGVATGTWAGSFGRSLLNACSFFTVSSRMMLSCQKMIDTNTRSYILKSLSRWKLYLNIIMDNNEEIWSRCYQGRSTRPQIRLIELNHSIKIIPVISTLKTTWCDSN